MKTLIFLIKSVLLRKEESIILSATEKTLAVELSVGGAKELEFKTSNKDPMSCFKDYLLKDP